MRLNVNPNRMELLRLRKRLVLAERGHKLLKDKLEEIMRRFLEIMRELSDRQKGLGARLNKMFLAFAVARCRHSWEELAEMVPEGSLRLDVQQKKIFNIAIPEFSIHTMEVSDYDLMHTDSEIDVGLKTMQELLPDLMEIARLWKAVALLAREIEVTRRRVNALEHILIPNIKETIKYIADRLEEMERSYQVQLMRIKDIVGER